MHITYLIYEIVESLTGVRGFHESLADKETTESGITELTDGFRIADTAFADEDRRRCGSCHVSATAAF